MLKKASFLIVGLAFVALAPGCNQGTTASEIMNNSGVLKDKAVARIIEANKADEMCENGTAHREYEVRVVPGTFGQKRVLVTKYSINGHLYRVDVRKSFDPLAGSNIRAIDLNYMNYEQQAQTANIRSFRMLRIYDAIRKFSYEAKPEIGYRAWVDSNGKIHPARIVEGKDPTDAWTIQAEKSKSLNLYVTTSVGPLTSFWLQGLTSDGRVNRADSDTNLTDIASALAGGGVIVKSLDKKTSNSPYAHDYRWLISGQGQLTKMRAFYNSKLYYTIKGCLSSDPS